MDNIIAKKIWADTYGFELEIRFVSRFVDVHSEIYVSAPMLLKNKDVFSELLSNNDNNRCKLCLGQIGGVFAPGVEMDICKTKTGHILIDVILELNDDASPKHECRFYIETELGLLERFIDSFSSLSDLSLETEISLNYY